MPLHVWLPEAHPAAPTHVSALMSGVMIKTGIYGLVRILTFLGPPPLWWGWVLCGIGLSSGVLGVLYALAQHDLKRLLAYHSVENIGIIALGLGVGLIGLSSGSSTLAVLGFAGGLLHVLNHALFKGLLFLGAGAVMHGAGTREIDHLGGLLKRMPWTGLSFLIGAVAISGLPPLNGFVSELLIYVSAFQGATTLENTAAVPALAVIAGLALIGGLAAACFAKAFGIVFLGEPRSDHAAHAHEAGMAVRLSLLLLAASCVLIGLCAPWVVEALAPALTNATGLPADSVNTLLLSVRSTFSATVLASLVLLVLLALLASLRHRLARATIGRGARHLGLRVCSSHLAYAVHGVVFCPTADEPVSFFTPHAFPLCHDARSVSARGVPGDGDGGSLARTSVPAAVHQYRARSVLAAVGTARSSTSVRVVHRAHPSRPVGVEIRLTLW